VASVSNQIPCSKSVHAHAPRPNEVDRRAESARTCWDHFEPKSIHHVETTHCCPGCCAHGTGNDHPVARATPASWNPRTPLPPPSLFKHRRQHRTAPLDFQRHPGIRRWSRSPSSATPSHGSTTERVRMTQTCPSWSRPSTSSDTLRERPHANRSGEDADSGSRSVEGGCRFETPL
jgi:hypothetical protein